jgi:hypothetical protein
VVLTRQTPGVSVSKTLNLAECVSRLEAVAADDDWDIDRSPPGDRMRVTLEGHRLTVQNVAECAPLHTFRRIFRGEMAEGPGGVRIRGRFGLHPAARLGLSVWFASATAIVLLIGVANVTGGLDRPVGASGWPGVVIPAAALAAAALLVRASLAQSRPREEAIVRFLTMLLDSGTPRD